HAAERVDQYRVVRAFDILEQERRAAARHFAHPVGNFGDFQNRTDLRLDPAQPAAPLHFRQEISQVAPRPRHRLASCTLPIPDKAPATCERRMKLNGRSASLSWTLLAVSSDVCGE